MCWVGEREGGNVQRGSLKYYVGAESVLTARSDWYVCLQKNFKISIKKWFESRKYDPKLLPSLLCLIKYNLQNKI